MQAPVVIFHIQLQKRNILQLSAQLHYIPFEPNPRSDIISDMAIYSILPDSISARFSQSFRLPSTET